MIIGLIRHFRVICEPDQKWMTSDQFDQWVEHYDKSEIRPNNYNGMNLDWDVCFCSDLSRASQTAHIIYKGPTIKTDQLRELGIRSTIQSKIKLHYFLWLFLAFTAWFISHKSQEESKDESLIRAKQFIDRVEKNYMGSNVLVVSHGAFMKLLIQELARRGYRGRRVIKPKNGELYTYERKTFEAQRPREWV